MVRNRVVSYKVAQALVLVVSYITLDSIYFRLYAKDVFLGLAARVKARTYCVLARNLALLAIPISI